MEHLQRRTLKHTLRNGLPKACGQIWVDSLVFLSWTSVGAASLKCISIIQNLATCFRINSVGLVWIWTLFCRNLVFASGAFCDPLNNMNFSILFHVLPTPCVLPLIISHTSVFPVQPGRGSALLRVVHQCLVQDISRPLVEFIEFIDFMMISIWGSIEQQGWV